MNKQLSLTQIFHILPVVGAEVAC